MITFALAISIFPSHSFIYALSSYHSQFRGQEGSAAGAADVHRLRKRMDGYGTFLLPAYLSTMPYPSDFARAIAGLPADALARIDRLQEDSNQLHHITDYSDPGEAVTAMTALGESLIRYAGNEDVTGHDNGPHYIDTLAGLFVRIGEGIAYQQRVTAAQKRVA